MKMMNAAPTTTLPLQLIGTGIALGFIHVLTGPDHLSALATLSSSDPTASRCYLFGLGARWGLGHSTGLMLVGGIFIMKDLLVVAPSSNKDTDDDDNYNDDDNNSHDNNRSIAIPESITTLFESFVGIFMLTLGIYGLSEAYKARYNNHTYASVTLVDENDNECNTNNNNNHGVSSSNVENNFCDDNNNDEDDDDDEDEDEDDNIHENGDIGNNYLVPVEISSNDDDEKSHNSDGIWSLLFRQDTDENNTISSSRNEMEEFRYNIQVMLGTTTSDNNNNNNAVGSDPFNDYPGHHHHYGDGNDNSSAFLACCAGIFHGLAGPGGVLGIIPAIQLHNRILATCYLLSFCITSTLTMGCFACLYGTFTSTLIDWYSRRRRRRNRSSDTSNNSDNESYENNNYDNNDDDNDGVNSSKIVVEFWIRSISASLSLIVGILWLVLLYLGKLEDVFG